MDYITNKRKLYNHNFIVFLFIMTVFYPFKGLINIGFFAFINDSDPNIFNKLCFIILFIFIIATTAIKGISFDQSNKLHIIVTSIVLVFTLYNRDIELFKTVTILFFLPLLFQVFDDISIKTFNKYLTAFFILTLLYMTFEWILLQIRVDGEFLISKNSYAKYLQIISPGKNIIDGRSNTNGLLRSGGYLANPLAMPALVIISAIYFYLSYKIYNKYLFYALIGLFLVIAMSSTTGIIAYALSILIIEIYYRKHLVLKAIAVIIFFIFLVPYHPSYKSIIIRIEKNMLDQSYVNTYFDFHNLLSLTALKSFLIGEWKWDTTHISSHIDLLLIVNSFGIILSAYIFYRIFFIGIINHAKHKNIYSIYSILLLPAFISLYHHDMTLNTNVMILVVLLSNRVRKIVI